MYSEFQLCFRYTPNSLSQRPVTYQDRGLRFRIELPGRISITQKVTGGKMGQDLQTILFVAVGSSPSPHQPLVALSYITYYAPVTPVEPVRVLYWYNMRVCQSESNEQKAMIGGERCTALAWSDALAVGYSHVLDEGDLYSFSTSYLQLFSTHPAIVTNCVNTP
jgi:hypothetical protein